MTEVAVRELRNNTAGVVRRAQAGENIVITVRGKPVVQLVPVRPERRGWLSGAELLRRMERRQADPDLRRDLAELAGETTDDLAPLS